MKPARMVLAAATGVLLAGAILVAVNLEPAPPPPLVVSLTQSNAPLQIFPGGDGVLMILPDGSLWTWGQTGAMINPAPFPAQVGTNREWWRASALSENCLALRTNGTLWEWGHRPQPAQVILDPAASNRDDDWSAVAVGSECFAAVKSNGTFWAWGNRSGLFGNFPDSCAAEPLQVDTNRDWAAVACMRGNITVGLRTNGTLWTWGHLPGATATPNAQICAGTNWVGVNNWGLVGPWACTREGDFWSCLRSMFHPNSNAPAAPILSVGPDAISPGHLAWAYTRQLSEADLAASEKSSLYRIVNGRLMAADLPFGTVSPSLGKWRQFARRTDWVGVWGAGTAFGLTADGTIWTWGGDLAAKKEPDLRTRLARWRVEVMEKIGLGPKTPVLPRGFTFVTPTDSAGAAALDAHGGGAFGPGPPLTLRRSGEPPSPVGKKKIHIRPRSQSPPVVGQMGQVQHCRLGANEEIRQDGQFAFDGAALAKCLPRPPGGREVQVNARENIQRFIHRLACSRAGRQLGVGHRADRQRIAPAPMSNGGPAFFVVFVAGVQPCHDDRCVHQDHGRVRRSNSSPEQ
jgi:hypothetical protein